MTYIVFNDKRVEGLEERSERSTKGYREGGNEIPSRSDKHRVVFCGFLGYFLSFVLIRILLTDGLLFENSGSQRANLVRFLKTMSVHEQDERNKDSLVSINAGPTLFKVSARATQSPEATFLRGFCKYVARKERSFYEGQNFQCDVRCSPVHDGIEVS